MRKIFRLNLRLTLGTNTYSLAELAGLAQGQHF
jgi:hypothetical protein